jgi:hypothetical protein
MREYMEAINTLRGDKAPANLRLSAEQDQKLQAIAADFRKEMEAFREKARSEGMDARAGGAKPERDANRARMEELRGEMPKPADYQTKAFAVLNADQQKHVQAEIEKLREGMEKRRGEEMMKRREGGQPGGPGPGGPGGARDEGAQRERVQKIMEKLRSLSPEERDRVLSRLEEQLQRMGGEGGQPPERRRGRQGGNAGENPPPPPPGNR